MSNLIDHRLLADEMEICFFNEEIGAGLPVWLPNGVAIRDELEAFVKRLEFEAGYHRVASPHLAKQDLFERSGHLKFFSESMYPPIHWSEEKCDYFLKPMNCPHHHKVFAAHPRSYRSLPFRIAEYGQVYRYEPSGSLKGLSRVRGLCQNDGHIYIDPKQAKDEILDVLQLFEKCYQLLGIKNYRYRLSLRDPNMPMEGKKDQWDKAEQILRQALEELGLEFFEGIGEAAFYGPKIDVQMQLGGHEESIASVQLDFLSAERFKLSYISSVGESEQPWIIHRAPLGSHERFIAMLLEYYKGQLPSWLAPVQLLILPLGEEQKLYCSELVLEFRKKGLRVKLDDSQGSLSKRIHFGHRSRPFAKLVVGPKEIKSQEFKLSARQQEYFGNIKYLADLLAQYCVQPR